ncbi:unnamed protein product [Alopecurus aequalis]
MSFPLLKQLSLLGISIPGDVFHGLLSGCPALESLFMWGVSSAGDLRVSSPALRSIGLERWSIGMAELVIEDAPCLERLLFPYCHPDDCVTIRVIRAPKLETFGLFSADSAKLQVFKGMSPVSSANSIRTIKVLALRCSNHRFDAILDVLRWLPCLEKLYVSFLQLYPGQMDKQNEYQYDPLHPIECLQTHLKKVVLKLYSAYEQEVDFARFFVLNAQVLHKIEFEIREDYSSESVDRQHKLLQVENRASRDVQFEFRNTRFDIEYHLDEHIHDLSADDPFQTCIDKDDCLSC